MTDEELKTELQNRFKVVFIHHTTDRPNEIESFMHCTRCLESCPDDMSPREWSSLEVGITPTGQIQVWCKHCEVNVDLIAVDIVPKSQKGKQLPRCDRCERPLDS